MCLIIHCRVILYKYFSLENKLIFLKIQIQTYKKKKNLFYIDMEDDTMISQRRKKKLIWTTQGFSKQKSNLSSLYTLF